MKISLNFTGLFCLFLFFAQKIQASSGYASSFGYDSSDATAALSAAFNSNLDTLIVDFQPSGWTTGPQFFQNINGLVVIFQPGVLVKAKPGAFGITDCLFAFRACKNFQIWGYDATFQMNKPEYTTAEWRHCLALLGCTNFKIYGLTLRDSGGDGVMIGNGSHPGTPTFSKNIALRDLWCDNNKRQGISVISVENLVIEHCKITNTNGTAPQAGIDFECDLPTERLVNCAVRDCYIAENAGCGIQNSFKYMNSGSLPVSITVERCHLADNLAEGFKITCDTSGVGGFYKVKNCLVENHGKAGFRFRKDAADVFIQVENSIFRNNANASGLSSFPIFFEVVDYFNDCPAIGGADFKNVLVEDDKDRDFLFGFAWPTSPGVQNITGNFTVVNSFGASFTVEPVVSNVNFSVAALANYPATTLNLTIFDAIAAENPTNLGSYRVKRTSSNRSFPLTVKYSVGGTATNRADFYFLNGLTIIPANATTTNFKLTARHDSLAEPTETAVLNLTAAPNYTIGNATAATVNIQNINFSGENDERATAENPKFEIEIFPNPVGDVLFFDFEKLPPAVARVFDLTGKLMFEKSFSTENQGVATESLQVGDLPGGVYFLEIDCGNGEKLAEKFLKK